VQIKPRPEQRLKTMKIKMKRKSSFAFVIAVFAGCLLTGRLQVRGQSKDAPRFEVAADFAGFGVISFKASPGRNWLSNQPQRNHEEDGG
jgi:hypothetical protein